jgi:hypothetical protein
MADNFDQPKAKPANDAYTGMLAISLMALLAGCVVLYLDYNQYPASGPPKVDYSFKDRSAPEMEIKREAKQAPEDNPDDSAKDIPAKKDQ